MSVNKRLSENRRSAAAGFVNRRGLARFAESAEPKVPVPLSAGGSRIDAESSAWWPARARKWELALGELLESQSYASDLKRPVWDFAVELDRLVEAGLTSNDLRWLSAKGYIEQAEEVSRPRGRGPRTFRPAAAAMSSLSKRTCIVLTKAGLALANQICNPPPGTGSFCEVRDAKGACPPLRGRFSDRLYISDESSSAGHAARINVAAALSARFIGLPRAAGHRHVVYRG